MTRFFCALCAVLIFLGYGPRAYPDELPVGQQLAALNKQLEAAHTTPGFNAFMNKFIEAVGNDGDLSVLIDDRVAELTFKINWVHAGDLGYSIDKAKSEARLVFAVLKVEAKQREADKEKGNTLLHRLVTNTEGVGRLLADGFDPNAKNKKGLTPLHYAAAVGNAKSVTVLIAAGAKVNARDNLGFTPLHEAARWGRPEAARALIQGGANPLAAVERITPLYLAKYKLERNEGSSVPYYQVIKILTATEAVIRQNLEPRQRSRKAKKRPLQLHPL